MKQENVLSQDPDPKFQNMSPKPQTKLNSLYSFELHKIVNENSKKTKFHWTRFGRKIIPNVFLKR